MNARLKWAHNPKHENARPRMDHLVSCNEAREPSLNNLEEGVAYWVLADGPCAALV